MGKYESLSKIIFSIFSSTEWTAENIQTYPDNFAGSDTGTRYIRVSLIPSGVGININSVSGQTIIDIFTPSGRGPAEYLKIADSLDKFLVGKLKQVSGNTVQFHASVLSPRGFDGANPALHRASYSIPFNFFGI